MLWREPVLDGHDDDAKLKCPLQGRVDPNSRDARHSNVEGTTPALNESCWSVTHWLVSHRPV